MTATTPDLRALYPVLGALPAPLAERIITESQIVTVPPGTIVFDERQACQGFPFVLNGDIRVVKPAANGRELPLYRVLPGESCIITSSLFFWDTPTTTRAAWRKAKPCWR